MIWKFGYHNGNIEHRNAEIGCLEWKQDASPEVAIKDNQKEAIFPFTGKALFVKWRKNKFLFQSQMQMGNHCSSFNLLRCFYQLQISHCYFEIHTVIQMEWWNKAKFTCFSWKAEYEKQEHYVTLGWWKSFKDLGHIKEIILLEFATETTLKCRIYNTVIIHSVRLPV